MGRKMLVAGVVGAVAVAAAVSLTLSTRQKSRPVTPIPVGPVLRSCIEEITKAETVEAVQEAQKRCAKPVREECDKRLAKADEMVAAATEPEDRMRVFEEVRVKVEDQCLEYFTLGEGEGSADILLGRNELGESDALEKTCKDTVKAIDTALSKEKDFTQRRTLFQKRSTFVDWCFKQWLSERHPQDRIPLLGDNAYGEKTARETDCKERIAKATTDAQRQALAKDCGDFLVASTSSTIAAFEFYDIAKDYAKSNGLPFGSQVHFLMVRKSTATDMRTFLPIRVIMTVDGDSFWEGTAQGDPMIVCGDANACSLDGPKLAPGLLADRIVIRAYDKNNILLAEYIKP